MKYIGIIIKNIRNFIRNLCSEDSPMEDIKEIFVNILKSRESLTSQNYIEIFKCN